MTGSYVYSVLMPLGSVLALHAAVRVIFVCLPLPQGQHLLHQTPHEVIGEPGRVPVGVDLLGHPTLLVVDVARHLVQGVVDRGQAAQGVVPIPRGQEELVRLADPSPRRVVLVTDRGAVGANQAVQGVVCVLDDGPVDRDFRDHPSRRLVSYHISLYCKLYLSTNLSFNEFSPQSHCVFSLIISPLIITKL